MKTVCRTIWGRDFNWITNDTICLKNKWVTWERHQCLVRLHIFNWDISLPLCITMAGGNSVKLFRFIQNRCQKFGFKLNQTNADRNVFNAIKSIFILCLAQFAVTSVAFLVYDAKSMSEYTAIFYGKFFNWVRKIVIRL